VEPQRADPVPAGFRPLRRAGRARVVATAVAGPLLWVVALAVLAELLDRRQAVELALLVAVCSVVVSVSVLIPQRARRVHREATAEAEWKPQP
jgi:hypothetical protein